MSMQNLDKNTLKLILKTSQGFPSQYESSKAIVKVSQGSKQISPSRSGHAISSHVRGATSTGVKTKFRSIDDMAAALDLLLKTHSGQQAIDTLRAGCREIVEADIRHLFSVEAVIDGVGNVTFDNRDFVAANIHQLRVLAILEARERAGELYLHVQTFYPKMNAMQLQQLIDAKTSP